MNIKKKKLNQFERVVKKVTAKPPIQVSPPHPPTEGAILGEKLRQEHQRLPRRIVPDYRSISPPIDLHMTFIESLDKAIIFHRTNPNDPHGISNAVICALTEVRDAYKKAFLS